MRFSTMAAAVATAGAVSAQSICDKYTKALLMDNTPANQYTLVTLLVKTAALGNYTGPGTGNPTLPGSMVNVPGILAPGMYNGEQVNLLPYFNGGLKSTNRGGMPVSLNFLDNGTPMELTSDPTGAGKEGTNGYKLFAHLISYFGVLLGCSGYGEDGFAAYTGSNNQYNVHKYMDLSEAEHSYFIQQVGLSAQSFGASQADIMMAATSLNTTFGYRCAPAAMVVPDTEAANQVICQGATCPLAEMPEAGCSGNAAVAGFTPTMPMSAMAAATSMPAGTGGMAMPTSSMPAGFNPNAAPRQTAAAGLMAGVAAVAAAML